MKIVLGTMTFGPQINAIEVKSTLDLFINQGYNEIDTAHVYNGGETERILGEFTKEYNGKLNFATKVNPRISGRLNRESIFDQLNKSLERLKISQVDMLYLHFPDPKTDIEETLSAVNELYNQGKLKDFGLSNFPSWQVVEIFFLCEKNQWLIPSTYQGMYNGLSRNVELELIPSIRKLGMRFYAFNPLAGGLLSGRYDNFNNSPQDGRFTMRPNYQDRYWKKSFFEGLKLIQSACEKNDISILEGAYRWLAHHSLLDEKKGDGIIIGGSSIDQIKENIKLIKKSELPSEVTESFDLAWEVCKSDSPSYFRHIT